MYIILFQTIKLKVKKIRSFERVLYLIVYLGFKLLLLLYIVVTICLLIG